MFRADDRIYGRISIRVTRVSIMGKEKTIVMEKERMTIIKVKTMHFIIFDKKIQKNVLQIVKKGPSLLFLKISHLNYTLKTVTEEVLLFLITANWAIVFLHESVHRFLGRRCFCETGGRGQPCCIRK